MIMLTKYTATCVLTKREASSGDLRVIHAEVYDEK
jgi:hypothetical protein